MPSSDCLEPSGVRVISFGFLGGIDRARAIQTIAAEIELEALIPIDGESHRQAIAIGLHVPSPLQLLKLFFQHVHRGFRVWGYLFFQSILRGFLPLEGG